MAAAGSQVERKPFASASKYPMSALSSRSTFRKLETLAYPRDIPQPLSAEVHKQLKTIGFREPY
jgi:hypothetical protein